MTTHEGFALTWLGHSTIKIDTSAGKTILVDPWVQSNPVTPDSCKRIDKLDLMLITHGHFDHMADALQIANATGCDVIANAEICHFMGSRGVQKCTGMNKGGTVEWNGIQITMVNAVHSSGITDGENMVYGGEAAGFMVKFDDDCTVYFAGDTDVFNTMKTYGERHKPDIALLPIGGHFTMDPVGAATAIDLLGVKNIVPIHWGTFPALKGTPADLARATASISDINIIEMKPGETLCQADLLGNEKT